MDRDSAHLPPNPALEAFARSMRRLRRPHGTGRPIHIAGQTHARRHTSNEAGIRWGR